MTTNNDTHTSEDDDLMAQASERLQRKLLQSQKPTLVTYQPHAWYFSASPPATSKTGRPQMLFGNYIRIGTCQSLPRDKS